MSAENVVKGAVINLTVNGTQLDLVTDESFDFDAGENIEDFDLAALTTTQSIPGNASPTVSAEHKVDQANKDGLQELGIVDETGSYQYDASSRTVDSIGVEYLDADNGTVELEHEFNDVLVELDGGPSHEKPVTFSWTGHINGEMDLAKGLDSGTE